MKKIILASLVLLSYAGIAYGYWVWTPDTGRWVNPKHSVKDTAGEQLEWAMHFYDGGDFDKAINEFKKLVSAYPNSKFAPKAQYCIGRSYEDKEEYYHAYLDYQKALDTYPHIENRDEIIEREYKIGLLFYEGRKDKILGLEILPATDKAIEIFEKVVANDPYGVYADQAEFKIGECYNKSARYSEAVVAFQRLIDEYPKSALLEEAKYQMAYSAYKASLDSDYDQKPTEEAIREFKDFVENINKGSLAVDANKVLAELNEKRAMSIFDIARFYENQRHFAAAAVYYKEITDKFSNTSVAVEALSRYLEAEKRAREIEEKRAVRNASRLKRNK